MLTELLILTADRSDLIFIKLNPELLVRSSGFFFKNLLYTNSFRFISGFAKTKDLNVVVLAEDTVWYLTESFN